MKTRVFSFLLAVSFSVVISGCGDVSSKNSTSSLPTASPTVAVQTASTPAKNFTATDVAKLKWLEGTWRGMDGDKPFYERYRMDGTTLISETLKEDGSIDGEPGRFELKNGEFGKGEGDKRSAASFITDSSIQFVPAVAGKGNSFRFEKTAKGWDAVLEWRGPDGSAQKKTYNMEPWTPPTK